MRSQRENICLMVAVQVPQEQQAAGMVIGAPSVRRNLITSTAKSARISGWLLCYVPLLCSGLCVAWRRGEDRSAIRLSYQILISQYSLILTHLKKQNKKNKTANDRKTQIMIRDSTSLSCPEIKCLLFGYSEVKTNKNRRDCVSVSFGIAAKVILQVRGSILKRHTLPTVQDWMNFNSLRALWKETPVNRWISCFSGVSVFKS